MSYYEPDYALDCAEERAEAEAQRRAARRHCTCNSASVEPCGYCQDREAREEADATQPSDQDLDDLIQNVMFCARQAQRMRMSGQPASAIESLRAINQMTGEAIGS